MTSYWFDAANKCFWFTPDTKSSNLDHLAAVKSMLKHPDYRPGVTRIWDLSETDLSRYSSATLIKLHQKMKPLNLQAHPSRLAFIVNDDLGMGIVRMYLGRSEKDDRYVEIFRDRELAIAWSKKPVAA